MDLGDLEVARAYRERLVLIAQRMGDPSMLGFALADAGLLLFLMGDWVGARTRFARAAEIAGRVGSTFFAAYPLILFGKFCIAIGERALADELLHRAILIGERAGVHEVTRYGRCLQAEACLIAGDVAGALATFDGMFVGSPVDELNISFILPTLAWALVAAGRLDEAEPVAAEAVRRCREEPNLTDLPDALRAAMLLAIARDRWEETEDLLTETLDVTAKMQNPYGRARGFYELGRALCTLGESERGLKMLQEALAIFEQLGSAPYVALTRSTLGDPVPTAEVTHVP
jgi:tetratricopeptide (TPR) repeat protein